MLFQLETIRDNKLVARYQISMPSLPSQAKYGRPDMVLFKYNLDTNVFDYTFVRDHTKIGYERKEYNYTLEQHNHIGFEHLITIAIKQTQKNIYNIKPRADYGQMNIQNTIVAVDQEVAHKYTSGLEWQYPNNPSLQRFYRDLNIDYEHLKMINLETVVQTPFFVQPTVQERTLTSQEVFEQVVENIKSGVDSKLKGQAVKDAYHLLIESPETPKTEELVELYTGNRKDRFVKKKNSQEECTILNQME